MSIKLLSEDTIQKIAAGEVIENPYSVIKELVENSIDSGATTIKVEIKNAGKKEIMISDNGCGIEENEIELAFTKHATSKLNNFEDIYSILSFGFRGEALASISSISKVDINTRTKNSEFGIHCFIENTKIKRKNKIGMNFGTTIYIRDLFYNVPIRKKFLKSDAYESSIITTLMNSFALSNPNISFKYIKDSKVVFETTGKNQLKDNIKYIFKDDFYKNLMAVDINDSDYKIYGYISNNHFYKGSRNCQYLFVNGRYIFDEKIRNIIEKSISTLIPKGKFPSFVIFIEVNPSLIDINVHPNKRKIKFIFEDKLLNLLNNNITDIVLKNTTSDFISLKTEQNDKILYINDNIKKQPEENDIVETIVYDEDYNDQNIINKFSYEDLFKVQNDDIKIINEQDDTESYIIDNNTIEQTPIKEQIKLTNNNENDIKNIIDYKILGKIFEKYILLSDYDEFIIIDILNAKYRLLYENLLNNYYKKTITKQLLLFPIILELNEYKMTIFENIKDKLDNLGIEADMFDEYSIAIRTMPTELNDNIDKEDIRAMFDELLLKDNRVFDESLYKIVCKKKINTNLTDFEVKELLMNLSKINIDINFYDKKILRKVSKLDFEKIFFKD
ncbi:DNA mismatch repair endonuclease MutL [Parvimonas micra]|jgi:DNA mismatch repair protein mutL|uniref:DNA mismatch repair endonuclease MutL n=2 Tax=Parvimonas TaxID=543311 RepID=UPI001E4A596B|nr:DNA mismatch repair endonuclease MutL [Parvimonas micra]MCE3019771.1 DNA mismatch repair endonuclease MutL [Parvimonas micra]